MELRIARKEDNDDLLELARLAPMIGVVDAFVDPSPDFFKFVSLQGDTSNLYVADDDSKILGCVAVSHESVRYEGEIRSKTYGSELKVHPESRGKKIGAKLAHIFVEKAHEYNDDIGSVAIIGGNVRSMKTTEKIKADQQFGGIAKIYQLMPYKNYRVSSQYLIRTATENDIDAIKEILHETYAQYNMSPLFDKDAFEKQLKKSDTFDISNMRVALKNGAIVACAGFWDQSSFRRTVVTRISTPIKAALMLLNVIRPFLKFPKPPKENETLKYTYLRLCGAKKGEIEALRSILHNESNEVRKLSKYHFLWAGFHEADPLAEIVSQMWKMSMDVNLIHFSFKDEAPLISEEAARKKPTYIDFSIV